MNRANKLSVLFLVLFILFQFQILFRKSPAKDVQLKLLPTNTVEENILGQRPICFENVSTFDLEQIPSISPRIAEELIYRRADLIAQSKKRHHSFEESLNSIKGIGLKRARTILKYLKLCSSS